VYSVSVTTALFCCFCLVVIILCSFPLFIFVLIEVLVSFCFFFVVRGYFFSYVCFVSVWIPPLVFFVIRDERQCVYFSVFVSVGLRW